MPLLTLQHCLVCFGHQSAGGTEDNNSQRSTSTTSGRSNAEVCQRFCTLVSRYLNLGDDEFNPEKTINTKWAVSITHACDYCAPVLKSFCETYENWQQLQLELSWKLEKISTLIRTADIENNEDHLSYRKDLQEKLTRIGSNSAEQIDKFRSNILQKVSANQNLSAGPPYLRLTSLEKAFNIIQPKRSRPSSMVTIDKGLSSQPKQSSDESDDQDLFTPVWIKKAKENIYPWNMTTIPEEAHDSPKIGAVKESHKSQENSTPHTLPSERTSTQINSGDHGGKIKKCKECGKHFASTDGLNQHKQFHQTGKPFECGFCMKRFKFKTSLYHHKKGHKTMGCKGNKKRTQKQLTENLITQVSENRQPEDQASPSSNNRMKPAGSNSSHSKFRVFDRRFIKIRPRPFKCNFCEKRFLKNVHLTNHIDRHIGYKPFLCVFCNYSFAQRTELESHTRCHTCEKPFFCGLCDMSFKQHGYLTRHMKRFH